MSNKPNSIRQILPPTFLLRILETRDAPLSTFPHPSTLPSPLPFSTSRRSITKLFRPAFSSRSNETFRFSNRGGSFLIFLRIELSKIGLLSVGYISYSTSFRSDRHLFSSSSHFEVSSGFISSYFLSLSFSVFDILHVLFKFHIL